MAKTSRIAYKGRVTNLFEQVSRVNILTEQRLKLSKTYIMF